MDASQTGGGNVTADTVSLEKHLAQMITDQDRYLCRRLEDNDKRLDEIFKAHATALEMSEKRMDLLVSQLASSLRGLEIDRATLSGKASANALQVTTLISLVGLLIGAMGLILRALGH
jgi:hypothetical protein